MNVLCPPPRLSLAPTRVKMRSTMPIRAARAGTNEPICARRTVSATCRIVVDLPAMFGPVTIIKRSPSASSDTSFGTNEPAAARRSTIGWRHSTSESARPSSSSGRT
jgi:hypothetical protein